MKATHKFSKYIIILLVLIVAASASIIIVSTIIEMYNSKSAETKIILRAFDQGEINHVEFIPKPIYLAESLTCSELSKELLLNAFYGSYLDEDKLSFILACKRNGYYSKSPGEFDFDAESTLYASWLMKLLGLKPELNTTILFEKLSNIIELKIENIIPGMRNVDVIGRVLRIFPSKSFKRTDGKEDKMCSMIIGDETGNIRVVVWGRNVNLIESGEIVEGDILKIRGGYTKENINGEPEIHINNRTRIIVNPADIDKEKFPTPLENKKKIEELEDGMVNVDVVCRVVRIYELREFEREDGSKGKVLNLLVADETGKARVVLWNEDVNIAERIREGDTIKVKNFRNQELNYLMEIGEKCFPEEFVNMKKFIKEIYTQNFLLRFLLFRMFNYRINRLSLFYRNNSIGFFIILLNLVRKVAIIGVPIIEPENLKFFPWGVEKCHKLFKNCIKIYIDVPVRNIKLIEVIESMGFNKESEWVRMVKWNI